MNWGFAFNMWIIALSFMVLVNGKARLTLKITKYQTDSHRRLDGRCCGDSYNFDQTTCSKPCKQKFKICLDDYHSRVSLTDPKPYNGKCAFGVTEYFTWGKSDLGFSYQYAYSYNFDIYHSWPVYIAIIIEAYDATNSELFQHAVIDRILFKNALKPSIYGTDEQTWHDITVPNGPSVYEFSIRLVCQENYFGVACNKYCKNSSDKQKTNLYCNKQGDKVCHDGYMGPNCNTTICKPGCHLVHGFCNKPGECLCTEGWKGSFCDECIKYPGCVHGTCADSPWTCYCQPNWGGYFCDKSINYCRENNPCKNGGICENQPSQIDPYRCICASGYQGKNCEIDHCDPNPCTKGTCIKSSIGFFCDCYLGWSGKRCEIDLTTCDPSLCKNGGKCQKDDHGMYNCICLPGYRGSQCQLSLPCDNSDCQNAKHCKVRSLSNRVYECICRDGWSGKYCDQDINECDNNPCKNGGVCKNTVGSYKCQCKPNFRGQKCEINIACDSRPCKNDGVCQEDISGFICKCKGDYSGKYCEVYKTGCRPNPCRNGAYCYTNNNDIYCQCPPDYWGKYCEHARPYCGRETCELAYDACFMSMVNNQNGSRQACGQHGSCVSKVNTEYECTCAPGFVGKYCEINVDDCVNHGCENNGICVDGVNDYECICENGYQGRRCEERIDYCQKNPCFNSAQCKSISIDSYNDFVCECTSLWSGRLCHLPVDKACSENNCLHGGSCSVDVYGSGGFKCDCKSGWRGTVCQFRNEQSKPCSQGNPCKNSGFCINLGDKDYICQCSNGYEGKHCELNTDECHPNPCFNGGKCIDLINSFVCQCSKGFYGSHCQSNFDECISHPCAYGSVCIDRIDGFECRCPDGRSDKLCDHVINSQKPQPPSCIYHNRTFDSGQHWSYNCQDCRCDSGNITCTKTTCGVWSCHKAQGPSDPYSCKDDEDCHRFPFDLSRCFVAPCEIRAQCIKKNGHVPSLTISWPRETGKHCRPNGNQKNNNCAQILLKFEKTNMPVGVTVDDICDAVKRLPVVNAYKDTVAGETLEISCEINSEIQSIINVAIYSQNDKMLLLKSTNTHRPFVHFLSDKMADNIIEVVRNNYSILSGLNDIKVETLLLQSDISDQSTLLKYMLIPLVLLGIFIVIVIIWHHRKKMIEIRQEFSTKTNFNNNNHTFHTISQPQITRTSAHNSGLVPIPTKYMAFPEKLRTENIPSLWSHGRHPFSS